MPLFNCKVNPIFMWSADFFISSETEKTKFAITHTKVYVPVVTLSTQGNKKLLKQLKSGFKRKINWNKYKSKVSIERQNQYLDYFVDPSFQGVSKLLVLLFWEQLW